MFRQFSAALAIAVGAFAPTFALLAPDDADAKTRRVAAVTSCMPDQASIERVHSTDLGDTYVLTHNTVSRGGDGLEVDLDEVTIDTIGVRCQVPTDSYMPHSTITAAHISGNKNAANGFASYAKACFTWWTNGSYSCTSDHALASGNFNRIINLGSIWSDANAFPMVTAVLADGDRLYGIYYTDQ